MAVGNWYQRKICGYSANSSSFAAAWSDVSIVVSERILLTFSSPNIFPPLIDVRFDERNCKLQGDAKLVRFYINVLEATVTVNSQVLYDTQTASTVSDLSSRWLAAAKVRKAQTAQNSRP